MPDEEYAQANIICVAGFIPTETSTGIIGLVFFESDNRDFSSNSSQTGSRFWLWISVDTGNIVKSYAHPTQRVSGPNGAPVGTPSAARVEPNGNPLAELVLGHNHFKSSKGEDGTIRVSYNAVCGDPICNQGLAANGSISFTPNKNGSYDAHGLVNLFPNLEAYHWNGGQPQNEYIFRMQNFSKSERSSGHASMLSSFGMATSTPFVAQSDGGEKGRLLYYLSTNGIPVVVEK